MDDVLKKHVDTLGAEIRQYLQKGIDLDPDTEALFSELTDHPITSLGTLLNRDSDDEIEPLISLIMTPDTHFQLSIEPFLWQFRMTAIDEENLISALGQPPPTIPIRPATDAEAVQWTPPDWAILEFISRLHLTWQIDARLFNVTNRFLTASEKKRVWVSLRGTQMTLTPALSQNLATFMTQKDYFGETFFDHLDILLTAWSDPNAHQEPYKALARLKGSYVKALQQNNRFEKASRSNNMETLMLQGVLTPTIDTETALRHISMIDNLTLTLFGQIVSVEDWSERVSTNQDSMKPNIT